MSDGSGGMLGNAPMHRLQITVVALCIALNGLDGFDVLAISFAAPGIAAQWHIDRAMLGVVLSMELIGMAVGSVLIGNLADRVGRRPTILACLTVMAAGMLLASIASGVAMLSIARVFTGLGIGGMLSSTSAMVAEFSNNRRRALNVSLNIAGYSTGAILGGLIASTLLAKGGNWRSVFVFGGVMTTVSLPLTYFSLPESIDFLAAKRPKDALDMVNRTLKRLGHSMVSMLPATHAEAQGSSIGALFSRSYGPVTMLLTIAYFAQIMLFYFVVKWIPKIVVDMGFDAASAGRVLVAANVGNLLGAISIGLASQKYSLRPLVVAAMLMGFAAIAVFGSGISNIVQLSVTASVAAFFINAGVVGLYPILAQTYPASLRAGGTGFVIGVGRGGSALGPVLAGALFASGSSLLIVSLAMGVGALIAASMLLLLPLARVRAPGIERAPL